VVCAAKNIETDVEQTGVDPNATENSKAVGGTQPRGRFWGQSFLRWETAMFAYKFTGVFVSTETPQRDAELGRQR
jgi:hypothetical protein